MVKQWIWDSHGEPWIAFQTCDVLTRQGRSDKAGTTGRSKVTHFGGAWQWIPVICRDGLGTAVEHLEHLQKKSFEFSLRQGSGVSEIYSSSLIGTAKWTCW